MAANQRLRLTPLTVESTKPQTGESVRRLKGAHDSITGLFGTLHTVRELKAESGVSIRKLTHGETDILRSALVFAGAGLDAVLKQLLRDALPTLLTTHKSAKGALIGYSGELFKDEPGKARSILVSPDPTAALQKEYIDGLTKGSQQKSDELIAVRRAFGITSAGPLNDDVLKGFNDFFLARNEVVHELDLTPTSGRGTFTRRTRKMDETRERCDAALLLAQTFIVETEALL